MVLIYRFADISVCECVFLPSELGYVFKVNSKQPQNINNTKKEVKQSNVAERNETNRKNDIWKRSVLECVSVFVFEYT